MGDRYTYYSTQRPVDLGTYPRPPDNLPVEIINYDVNSRIPVEGEVFEAWGELTYAKPLTDRQQDDYELRPSRDNPDVRVKMRRQAQVVGPWEEYHSIPEEQRETEYDHARGLYRPRQSVSPERLKTRYISVKMSPVPNWHTPKRKDTPRHGAR